MNIFTVLKLTIHLSDPDLPVGKVIGVDLLKPESVDGVTFLAPCDFMNPETHEKILRILNGEKADIVLSDMVPNVTGVKELDQDNLVELLLVFIR